MTTKIRTMTLFLVDCVLQRPLVILAQCFPNKSNHYDMTVTITTITLTSTMRNNDNNNDIDNNNNDNNNDINNNHNNAMTGPSQ